MAYKLTIELEDDFADILGKLRNAGIERIVEMHVVRDALLFSDEVNLVELKKRTDAWGMSVTIETADTAGASFARAAGYATRLLLPHIPNQQPQTKIPSGSFSSSRVSPPQPSTKPLGESIPRGVSIMEAAISPVKRSTNRTLAVIFSLAMVVLLLLAFVILPEADITIYPKTELLTRDMQVTVDTGTQAIDVNQLVIPGSSFSSPEQFTQEFSATGSSAVGANASGMIQIYNFSGHVLKLLAANTTLTAGSSTYHLVSDDANIPVTRYYSGSKTDIDPSSLSSPVMAQAVQSGITANVAQGTRFDIQSKGITASPTQLYAVSTTDFAGGTSSATTVVSQSDQDAATSSLPSSMLTAVEQQLNASKGLTLINSGTAISGQSITFDHSLLAATPTFSGTINATVQGLAFNKLDLVKLVEQRIALTLPAGMYLVTDESSGNAETISESFQSYVAGSNTGILMVHVVGIIASNVDITSFGQQFKGKSIAQIQGTLANNSAIQGADIILKPFWVRSAPRFLNKIYITTKVVKPQTPAGIGGNT